MANEEIIKEITTMPEKDKRIVESLTATIHKRLSATRSIPAKKKESFRGDPFFCIYADRGDMKEGSAAWVFIS